MLKKLIIPILFLALQTLAGCSGPKEEVSQEIIVVRIPPFIDPKLTPAANNCVFQMWWHSPVDAPSLDKMAEKCKFADAVSPDLPLIVELRDDSSITVGGHDQGNLSNLDRLTDRLREFFETQAQLGIGDFTSHVERDVAITIHGNDQSYSNLFAVADAVKKSGANSIILMLEGHLPYAQLLSVPRVKNNR